jgi:hypothetical protein
VTAISFALQVKLDGLLLFICYQPWTPNKINRYGLESSNHWSRIRWSSVGEKAK